MATPKEIMFSVQNDDTIKIELFDNARLNHEQVCTIIEALRLSQVINLDLSYHDDQPFINSSLQTLKFL